MEITLEANIMLKTDTVTLKTPLLPGDSKTSPIGKLPEKAAQPPEKKVDPLAQPEKKPVPPMNGLGQNIDIKA